MSAESEAIATLLRASRPTTSTPLEDQRAGFDGISNLLAPATGVTTSTGSVGGVPVEEHTPSTPPSPAPSETPAASGPDGQEDPPVVLHLHGGGFCIGSPASHRSFASHLAAATGGRVVVADYRLAPENPRPAAGDDVEAVYRALAAEVGAARLVVSGDSAGGGLVVALLGRLLRAGLEPPAGVVALSPFVDLDLTGSTVGSMADAEVLLDPEVLAGWVAAYDGPAGADGHPDRDLLDTDLVGCPPMLVLVGSEEILLDDARRLAARAEESGVDVELQEWEGMFHVWPVFAPALPEAMEAIRVMAEFAASCTARRSQR